VARSVAEFREARRQAARRWRAKHAAWELWYAAQRRARRQGLPFEITPEDVIAVWPRDNRCPALRKTLVYGGGDFAPTLDRLEPGLGYVRSNIAVISARANRIKSNARASEIAAVGRWAREQETARSRRDRTSKKPVNQVPE
jgi:hypothetical protein